MIDQLDQDADEQYAQQNDAAKDDDIGSVDEAINSYVVYPIVPMAYGKDGNPIADTEGRLNELVFDTAGGASGGTLGDTDGFTYSIYTANDPETVLESIIDGDTPKVSNSVLGTGRKNKKRDRVRGAYLGIKLSNSTAAQSWAINKILFNSNRVGGL